MDEDSRYRVQLWDYYDRRVELRAQDARARTQNDDALVHNALEYWHWLGVTVSAAELKTEHAHVLDALGSLEPAMHLEVGSGPGTYTSALPGQVIALDQSATSLRLLGARLPGTPAVRADALSLPLLDRSVQYVSATHIYGILGEADRGALLQEARRVAHQLVLLDSGRPAGIPGEQWQQRTSGLDQRTYHVLRRHFDADELADEIGGHVLFAGRFYVVVIAALQPPEDPGSR
jgi:Methyltransferase domain